MSSSLLRIFVRFGMLAFFVGCAGSPGPGPGPSDGGTELDSGTPSGLVSADNSAASIRAFLDAKTYQGSEWVAETAAPRPESSGVSPHDNVRVYLNSVLRASQKAGNGASSNAPPHPKSSMVVKEIYDGTSLLGHAVMLKTEDGAASNAWTYYCVGPASRCASSREGTPANPIYGKGVNIIQCSACHGGMVFTQAP